MNLIDLKYPILCQTKHGLSVLRDSKWLAVAFVADLRSDYYEKLIITDSKGATYSVVEVIKAGWGTPFFGFSLKLSRRVKINLKLDRASKQYSLLDMKNIVLRDFRISPEWSARGDLDKLKQAVASASSIGELVESIR